MAGGGRRGVGAPRRRRRAGRPTGLGHRSRPSAGGSFGRMTRGTRRVPRRARRRRRSPTTRVSRAGARGERRAGAHRRSTRVDARAGARSRGSTSGRSSEHVGGVRAGPRAAAARRSTPDRESADRRRAAARALSVPRRLRLDAELVRRGLARSREHAAELIAAGRVRVSGAVADQAGHRGDHRRRDRGARGPGPPGLRLPRRAQAGRGAGGVRARRAASWPGGAASTRGRRRAASPTCCCGRRARGGGGRRRLRPAGLAAAAATSGCVVHDRTNIRELTAELIGGPVDLVVGDLSFISPGAGAGPADRRHGAPTATWR